VKRQITITVLGILSLLPSVLSQPSHLKVVGDPGSTLALAPGWVPRPVVRDGAGSITSAPMWSSHWADTAQFAADAQHPPRVVRLLKQDPGNVLRWGVKEYKLRPVVITTEHAVLVMDLGALRSREATAEERKWLAPHFRKKLKRKLSPVQVAHLYALRYLRCEAMFKDLLCLDGGAAHARDGRRPHFGSLSRSELYVFSKEKPYQEFGRHFFGASGRRASWWWHKETETVIGALYMGEDAPPVFAARFDYMVAHNLLYQYEGFYHYIPAWIPTGLAHHFERRHEIHENTYLLLGLADGKYAAAWRWDRPEWWREAKILVDSGEHRKLTVLGLQTKYIDLDPRYHVQAWSLVNYMLGMGKERFRIFIDVMKRKSDDESLLEVQQRALLEAYGVNQVQFESAWADWVRRTKPPKKRKRG